MRLIDAEALDNKLGCSDRDMYISEILAEAPTVVKIPNNATNGEVLKALFPNDFRGDICVIKNADWWISPYKEGDK